MFLLRAACPGRHPFFFRAGNFLPSEFIRTANLEFKLAFGLLNETDFSLIASVDSTIFWKFSMESSSGSLLFDTDFAFSENLRPPQYGQKTLSYGTDFLQSMF
jgi:hypothetical protein